MWFRLRREGFDLTALNEIKEGILARQNAELEKRRDVACKELRSERDTQYAGILKDQREERARLRQRQGDGLRSYELLDHQHEAESRLVHPSSHELSDERAKTKDQFGKAAEEITTRRDTDERPTEREEMREAPVFEPSHGATRNGVKHPLEPASLLPLAGLAAVAEFGERLFDGFLGGGTPTRPPERTRRQHRPSNDNPQARAADGKERAEQSEAEEAALLQRFWEERRTRRQRSRD